MTSKEQETSRTLPHPLQPAQCTGEPLLRAEFPHTWRNAAGEEVTGVRAAVLCPQCDRGEPATDALLALFTLDRQLGEEELLALTDRIAAWVNTLRTKSVDIKHLDAEFEAWCRGELDGAEAAGSDDDTVS
ncbi:DUF6300 family protein [Streptomyces sp. NPDC056549]|uniref:DUF6300 family protein n=1 Tax=Streptomyces sp. NPDC056549 TaxID=3345864 RepID=UPI0036C6611D